MITFIIPTIGRPSLARSIQSLLALTDPDWRAIVVFDGIDPTIDITELDERILVTVSSKLGNTKNHGQGGLVRNVAFPLVQTEWVGFLDDDDTLMPGYIDHLKEELEGDPALQAIIFRMWSPHYGALPPFKVNHIAWGITGISFCLRKSVLQRYQLRFSNADDEDFNFLTALQNTGVKLKISPHISYRVNH